MCATTGVAYTAAMIGLGTVWYKGEPKTRFHFFNDNDQWLQMDKYGHMATAFQESKTAISLLGWSGVSRKKSIIYGSLAGFLFQAPIEIFDGFSPSYGASYGDFLANAAGGGLAFAQYMLWDESRLNVKISFHRTPFARQRPKVLGGSLAEEFFKDYNGQTYWLSANMKSFMPKKNKIPAWLNISLGYGAENMIYARTAQNFDSTGLQAYRQWYVSLDVDFERIPVKNKFLKILLSVANTFKIPFPAVEFNRHGIVFRHLYF